MFIFRAKQIKGFPLLLIFTAAAGLAEARKLTKTTVLTLPQRALPFFRLTIALREITDLRIKLKICLRHLILLPKTPAIILPI